MKKSALIFSGIAGLALLGGVVAASLRGGVPDTAPVFGHLQDFELRDHEGRPYTLNSLKGTVHVVNFIFTHCPGVCPMMTRKMNAIEEKTRARGAQLKFLSISVDPQRDTPEKLKQYARNHGANLERWSFLTGDLGTVRKVVVNGFRSTMEMRRTPASEGSPSLMEIVHGEHFIVVDKEGRLRAFQKVEEFSDTDRVIEIAETLL